MATPRVEKTEAELREMRKVNNPRMNPQDISPADVRSVDRTIYGTTVPPMGATTAVQYFLRDSPTNPLEQIALR